ncbi:MAG: hypothetical protein J6Z79_02105, partial [Clostridia bacterium]|nr:hypothetical protein [Clostridia bacterium]
MKNASFVYQKMRFSIQADGNGGLVCHQPLAAVCHHTAGMFFGRTARFFFFLKLYHSTRERALCPADKGLFFIKER